MQEASESHARGSVSHRAKGDFNKKSKFLNVRQRENLRLAHSAWEPVDDQSKRQLHGERQFETVPRRTLLCNGEQRPATHIYSAVGS
jgi:hypothetical protein